MRPDLDHWMLELASVVAKRSTCLRRAVGCILVDSHGHVLSTGYNGVAAGMPHCNSPMHSDKCSKCGTELVSSNMCLKCGHVNLAPPPEPSYPNACSGARSPSGQNLDGCQAIHAEQNALLQCRDVNSIVACYVTTSPCLTCTKLLMNTSCSRIVFRDQYAQPEAHLLWLRSRLDRLWVKL